MINNEFHLIGVATSNYLDTSNGGNFHKYLFSVEVEVLGSKVGKTNRVDIEVYGTNRAVEISKNIMGKQVAVNGYIDSYYSEKTDKTFIKLVAQNVMVLDRSITTNVVASTNTNVEPPLPKEADPVVDAVVDDDLPF